MQGKARGEFMSESKLITVKPTLGNWVNCKNCNKQKTDDLHSLIEVDAEWLESNKVPLKFNLPVGVVSPIIQGTKQKWFGAEVYILCRPSMHPNQDTVTVQHEDGTVGYFCEQEVLIAQKIKEVEVDNYQLLASLHHKVNLQSFTLQERLKRLVEQNATIGKLSTSADFYNFSSWSDKFKYVLDQLVVPNIQVVDDWEIEILKQLKLIKALEIAAGYWG